MVKPIEYHINGQFIIQTYPMADLLTQNGIDALANMSYEEVKNLQEMWDRIELTNQSNYQKVINRVDEFVTQVDIIHQEKFGSSMKNYEKTRLLRYNLLRYNPYQTSIKEFLKQPTCEAPFAKTRNSRVPNILGKKLIDTYERIRRAIDLEEAKRKLDSFENKEKVELYLDFCEELKILRKVQGLNYDKLIKFVNKLCKDAIMRSENDIKLDEQIILEGDLPNGFAFIYSNKKDDKITRAYSYNSLLEIIKGSDLLETI